MPPAPRPSSSSYSSPKSRTKPAACHLCYRPIDTDDPRFCSTCKPKAKRLNRE